MVQITRVKFRQRTSRGYIKINPIEMRIKQYLLIQCIRLKDTFFQSLSSRRELYVCDSPGGSNEPDFPKQGMDDPHIWYPDIAGNSWKGELSRVALQYA